MLDSLRNLLEEQIKDLYSAENQLIKALPRMAKAASSKSLREAFESHLDETRHHAERLQSIAQILEIKPGGKKCKAMEGLVEEGKEVLEEDGEGAVIDAALIAAAQRVEHYEISAYGSARAMADQLGASTIIKLLQKTLDEESAADE
jgi:ferritin-like metal-binding protein YciE